MMIFESKLTVIEKNYPDIKIINSECPQLSYMIDDKRRDIGIINNDGMIKLTAKQVRALIKELKDVYDVYIK